MTATIILDNVEAGETLTLQLLTPGADAAPIVSSSLTAGDTRTHRYSVGIDPVALSIADGTELAARIVDGDGDLYFTGWVTVTDGASCLITDASEAELLEIQSRLPGALEGGAIKAHVISFADESLTEGAFADDAVSARVVASDAVTAIQSGLATSAGQSTINTTLASHSSSLTAILNRIGSFTGSGINTILGLFQALLRKDADVPTDVGGTFEAATDSVQAIRDRGDAAWTGSGGGGVTVTGFGQAALVQLLAQEIRIGTITKLGGKLSRPLIQGSSYSADQGQAIEIPVTSPDLTAADSVALHLVLQSDDSVAYSVDGEVIEDEEAGTVHARFEPTSAVTAEWQVGDYHWTITAAYGEETIELPHGELTVSRSYSS